MSEERAQRAANNKSLRIIKNELEALAERGFITDDQYDTIVTSLPAEASLGRPTPSATPSNTLDSGLAAMSVNDRSISPAQAPPSYQQAAQPPPPPPPSDHKEVAHAVALWRYMTPDARDLNFEPGDHISVTEFVNAEWWLGKNARSGDEGIFPSNYVRRENYPSPLAQAQQQQPRGAYYGDQKYNPAPQQYQQPQQQYQQPQQYHQPGPSNPYANPVPPMAIAQQPGAEQQQQQPGEEKPNKGLEMGKKIGGKLGNAAIFGAGATIGGNIVNSIF